MATSLQVLTSTTGNKTDCWNTPASFVKDVIDFFEVIDLDPCCDDINQPNVPANKYFTKDSDGLSQPWLAESVFMNHPYSNSKEWVPYAASQYETGFAKEMILLIKLDVSTKWWNSISKYPWIAVNTRLKFGNAKSAAPFQSAIIYLGNNLTKFKKVFMKYGTLYQPITNLN
tara:strand:- start:41 stop:556 length:516 start_codon:yes stop_codon:yes gene_type:complete